MAHAPSVHPMPRPARNAAASWVAVALVPFLFGLWFWFGMALIGDPNEPTAPKGWDGAWRVTLLWIVVEIVPVAGVVFGRRATRRGEPGGRAALVTNALIFVGLTLVTLVGGLSDVIG
jgi:hypothetical protein